MRRLIPAIIACFIISVIIACQFKPETLASLGLSTSPISISATRDYPVYTLQYPSNQVDNLKQTLEGMQKGRLEVIENGSGLCWMTKDFQPSGETTKLPTTLRAQIVQILEGAGVKESKILWSKLAVSPCEAISSTGKRKTPFHVISYFHKLDGLAVMGDVAHISMIYQDNQFICGDILMPEFVPTSRISSCASINSALQTKLSNNKNTEHSLVYARNSKNELTISCMSTDMSIRKVSVINLD